MNNLESIWMDIRDGYAIDAGEGTTWIWRNPADEQQGLEADAGRQGKSIMAYKLRT